MSSVLRIAIVGDGPSDAALWPIISWLIADRFPAGPDVANAGFVERSARTPQEVMDEVLLRLEPDLIIFHRDAEREDRQVRRQEIPTHPSVVPVIPVRMTEAWLLIDAKAIAEASNNPGFKGLALPPLNRLEALPDPKSVLRDLLLAASDLPSQRHRKRFRRDLGQLVGLVADYIDSYAPLRALSAFRSFEEELEAWLSSWMVRPRDPAAPRGPAPRRTATR